MRNADRIGRVYAFDLTGAGAGAACVLVAMYLVHAFQLVPLLLVPLTVAAVFCGGAYRVKATLAAVVALVAAEAVLLLDNQADYNDFKAIYAPLHTPDAKIAASVNSPRGDYALLVDTDISNNAGMLGVEGAAAQLWAVSRRQPDRGTCRAGRSSRGMRRRRWMRCRMS